jgi:hypothetical protein
MPTAEGMSLNVTVVWIHALFWGILSSIPIIFDAKYDDTTQPEALFGEKLEVAHW